MKNKLIIFGNEDLARLVYYYVKKDDPTRTVEAFTVNEKYIKEESFCGLPVIPFENIEKMYPPEDYEILLAVGYSHMNDIRKTIFEKCKEKGYNLANYIHSSVSNNDIEMGEGNIILESCLLYPYAKMGNGNFLWDHILISHDVVVGDFNLFTSYADTSGYVTIGNNCFLAKHCIIKEHVKIADYTLVGANAYVSKDTNEYDVIVPARSLTLENKKSTNLI